MGFRYNERNVGSYTLEGASKGRIIAKDKKMTEADRQLAKAVLLSVYEAMEYDKGMSEGKGHLNPDAVFTDGGRFMLTLSRTEFEALYKIIFNKL